MPGSEATSARGWPRSFGNRPPLYVDTRVGVVEAIAADGEYFEREGERLARKYLVEAGVAPVLESEFRVAAMDFAPIDPDDLYSKYEATPPEWFWIEH